MISARGTQANEGSSLTSRSRRKGGLSLQAQVAFVIGLLSFLPNGVVALSFFGSLYGAALPRSLWLTFGTWMLGVALLSAGLGYALSRLLLAPLTKLSEQIDVLQSRRGRLTGVRLELAESEPKEVRLLKISFNTLLAQVSLEQSRRSSFMATLMHDLKTPLVAANHLLAVIRDTDSLPREERIDIVSRILSENKRLTELVQGMVDAHKFERDDVPLKREKLELKDLVAGVLERVRPLAEERGLTLTLRGEARAVADARELERALYNLLSNAVRYARSTITAEIFSGMIRLSDDGPGLPAPLETLAQPFNAQPVDIAGERYTAGTGGLGLFIARRIIEAHGGRLVTERTGPQGTVFLVYLKEAV